MVRHNLFPIVSRSVVISKDYYVSVKYVYTCTFDL